MKTIPRLWNDFPIHVPEKKKLTFAVFIDSFFSTSFEPFPIQMKICNVVSAVDQNVESTTIVGTKFFPEGGSKQTVDF